MARSCENCGTQMEGGQQWCLQCGAAAPGSLAKKADWRPLAALAAAGAILLAGAGTAAYAALNQHPRKLPTHVLIAQVPAPAATTPPAGSSLNTPPSTSAAPNSPALNTPGGLGTRGSSRLGLPSGTIKPPKLPALVPTPRTSESALIPTHTGATPLIPTRRTTTPTTTPSTGGGVTTPAAQTPNPILLDTNAASTYNPSGYPPSGFGDPSLAIDGETATAWTAQVDPATAPRMAEGLALDLKAARRLGSLEIHTATPGLTLEIYGSAARTLPPSIVDPAWTKLSDARLLKKKITTLKLHGATSSFRHLVLWLVKAPLASIGTAQAPGHVSVNELVLFPPAK